MYIYVHVCIHVYRHISISISIFIYLSLSFSIYISLSIYIHTYMYKVRDFDDAGSPAHSTNVFLARPGRPGDGGPPEAPGELSVSRDVYKHLSLSLSLYVNK